MSYIISWSEGSGKILIDDTLITIFDKPSLSFEFDAIYYETPTSLFIKVLNETTYNLSEEEKAACVKYCLEFKESDDFPVVAIDPSYNVFMGIMSKKEATDKGFTAFFDITAPDFTPAIYEDNSWVKIVKAITSDGYLVESPMTASKDYVMLFTEKTWKTFPHPSHVSMIYDFKTEEWIDSRNFTFTLERAKNLIRNEALLALSKYDLLKTEVDPVLYLFQYNEFIQYKKDPSAPIPFVNAVCGELGVDIDTFMKRIESKYDEDRLTEVGAIHGRMIKYLDMLSECSTLEEIDAIMETIPSVQTVWNIRVY